jgi:hypothetical protein
MTIARQEGDKYAVTAQFANTGDTHYTPTAVTEVRDAVGNVPRSATMETTAKLVLPLGTPEFSGVVDFDKLPAGSYFLVALMTFGQGKNEVAGYRLPLKVEDSAEGKLVSIVEAPPPAAGGGEAAGGTSDAAAGGAAAGTTPAGGK